MLLAWCVQVKKQEHKSLVEDPETAVSALFMGRLESSVTCAGAKPSVTVQPFTALGLHIQSDKVRDRVAGRYSVGRVNPRVSEHALMPRDVWVGMGWGKRESTRVWCNLHVYVS